MERSSGEKEGAIGDLEHVEMPDATLPDSGQYDDSSSLLSDQRATGFSAASFASARSKESSYASAVGGMEESRDRAEDSRPAVEDFGSAIEASRSVSSML